MSKNSPTQQNNIEQIRDLIFGQQMQDYQQKFDQLTEEVAEMKRSMNASFEKINKALDILAADGKHANSDLLARINDTDNRFKEMLAATENRLNALLNQLDDQSAKRDQLADYLVEMGNRLRNGAGAASAVGEVESTENE